MKKIKYTPNTPYWSQKAAQKPSVKNGKCKAPTVEEARNISYAAVAIIFLVIGLLLFIFGGFDMVIFWLTPKGL